MYLIERVAGSRQDAGLLRDDDASASGVSTAAEGSSKGAKAGHVGHGRGSRGRGTNGRTGRSAMTRRERGKYKYVSACWGFITDDRAFVTLSRYLSGVLLCCGDGDGILGTNGIGP
jgi:hypothetical protein